MAMLPIPVIALLIFLSRKRLAWSRAVLWIALEIAGMGCFFAATLEQFLNRFQASGYEQPDTFAIALGFGLTSFICGAAMLLLIQLKPQAQKPGPYCPQCGYCLIGSTQRICSECGRPFTFDELGIVPEMLVPARQGQSPQVIAAVGAVARANESPPAIGASQSNWQCREQCE